jgi:cell division protein FtsB
MVEKITFTDRMEKFNAEMENIKANPPSEQQRKKNKRNNWLILLVLFCFLAYGCVDLLTVSDKEQAEIDAQAAIEAAKEVEEAAKEAEQEAIKAENERLQAEEIAEFEKSFENTFADYGMVADVYIDPSGFSNVVLATYMYPSELEVITEGLVKGIRNMQYVTGHTVYVYDADGYLIAKGEYHVFKGNIEVTLY